MTLRHDIRPAVRGGPEQREHVRTGAGVRGAALGADPVLRGYAVGPNKAVFGAVDVREEVFRRDELSVDRVIHGSGDVRLRELRPERLLDGVHVSRRSGRTLHIDVRDQGGHRISDERDAPGPVQRQGFAVVFQENNALFRDGLRHGAVLGIHAGCHVLLIGQNEVDRLGAARLVLGKPRGRVDLHQVQIARHAQRVEGVIAHGIEIVHGHEPFLKIGADVCLGVVGVHHLAVRAKLDGHLHVAAHVRDEGAAPVPLIPSDVLQQIGVRRGIDAVDTLIGGHDG